MLRRASERSKMQPTSFILVTIVGFGSKWTEPPNTLVAQLAFVSWADMSAEMLVLR